MAVLERKRGDTTPFEAVLLVNGAPANLEGVERVEFHMQPSVAGQGPSVSQVAEVVQTGTFPDYVDKGMVRYFPTADDVGISGAYKQEWEVFYADSTSETFPATGYVDVLLKADLG